MYFMWSNLFISPCLLTGFFIIRTLSLWTDCCGSGHPRFPARSSPPDYIIIPKSSLQEERSCPQLELCGSEPDVPQRTISVSNTALETVPGHAGMAEQCLAVEALAEDVGALAQPGAVQEIATSEILGCDVLLNGGFLEVGESHQPYQTSLVIEETLVNGPSDLTTGSLAVPHPQVGESMSVVTVMRVSDRYCD